MFQLGPVEIVQKILQADREHTVRLWVRPPDEGMREAIAELVEHAAPESDWKRLFTPGALALCIDKWEGFAGPDGSPLEPDPFSIGEVCSYSDTLHAALIEAVLSAVPRLARGNSKPSPVG